MSDTESQAGNVSRGAISQPASPQIVSRRTYSWTSDNDDIALADIGHLRAGRSQPQEATDVCPNLRTSNDDGIVLRDNEHSRDEHSRSYEVMDTQTDPYIPARVSQPILPKPADDDSPKSFSGYHRIGLATVSLLTLATLVSLAVIAFTGFISYGTNDQQIWHAIVLNGWATRALTISALVLRTCTDVQAGFVVCMLASIALEMDAVSLFDVPAIAFARASSIPPYMLLLRRSFCKMPFRRQVPWSGPLVLIPLLCLTTILLQFTSTILVSDLALGTLPGSQYEEDVFYDFEYVETPIPGMLMMTDYPLQLRQSTWLQSPPSFPNFAEYKEEVPVVEGVDDTGVLLRAFVPFPQALKRETLRNYSGKASVLDSRVSCQAPLMENLNVTFAEGWTILDFKHIIEGTFRPSRAADRLEPTSDRIPKQIRFSCDLSLEPAGKSSLCSLSCPYMRDGDVICIGGLLSQFANVSKQIIPPDYNSHGRGNLSISWGHPYLFWDSPIKTRDDSNSTTATNVTGSRQHGVWTEVLTGAGVSYANVTLCHTSWDMARMEVEMFSDKNRTESVGSWNPQMGLQTTPDIVQQFGNGIDYQRPSGALHLRPKTTWTRHDEDEPPLNVPPLGQLVANMLTAGAGRESTVDSPISAGLTVYLEGSDSGRAGWTTSNTPIVANEDLSTLFRRFRSASGSVAWALASMITMLSSMAYYDQMPRFQTSTRATQVHFTTVLYPQSHLGFLTVTILVSIHLVIVAATTFLFLKKTRYTLLGNYWQSLAQIQTAEILDLSSGNVNATDKEVFARAREDGSQQKTFKFPVPSVEEHERDSHDV
jgi:hypothetical protein